MFTFPNIKPIADVGILVAFGDGIDDVVHGRVLAMDQAVQEAQIDGVLELIPAYASLYVAYDPLVIGYDQLAKTVGIVFG